MILLFLITRDESDLLRLWIEHHLSFGVDHMMIVDHLSRDDTPEILSSYNSDVTVFRLPKHSLAAEGGAEHIRDVFLTQCLKDFRLTYGSPDWVGLIDTDEFIWGPEGNIPDILRSVPPGFSAVNLEQKLFVPTEDDRPSKNPIHRLIWTLEPAHARFFSYAAGKSFYRGTEFLYFSGPHRHRDFQRYWRPDNLNIYHYPVRSREQFVKKVSHLRDWSVVDQRNGHRINKHKLEWFQILDTSGDAGLTDYYDRQIVIPSSQLSVMAMRGDLRLDCQFSSWHKKHRSSDP
jgi:glycosyl transferase family 2